jgi:hypothetical protein
MLLAMLLMDHRSRHVNDPFDQFRFLNMRRRFVAALELFARQTIALFQCRGNPHTARARWRGWNLW